MANKSNESKINEATAFLQTAVDIITEDIFRNTNLIFFPIAIDPETSKSYPLITSKDARRVFEPTI